MDWTEGFAAAVYAMRSAVGDPWSGRSTNIRAVLAAKPLLPYVLHPVPDMPDVWIWVNRAYKPLGTAGGWARYQDYAHLHVNRDDPRIARLKDRCLDWGAGDGVALFNDNGAPWLDVHRARRYADLLKLVDYEGLDLDCFGL